MSNVRVELELPEGPASSGDRTRELALLEAVIASRRVSVEHRPPLIQVLAPADEYRLDPSLVLSPSLCRFSLCPIGLT